MQAAPSPSTSKLGSSLVQDIGSDEISDAYYREGLASGKARRQGTIGEHRQSCAV